LECWHSEKRLVAFCPVFVRIPDEIPRFLSGFLSTFWPELTGFDRPGEFFRIFNEGIDTMS